MWKGLQQELAKSKCVSRASVQETTRIFMEKRLAELDRQAKPQQHIEQPAGNRRRSSISANPRRRSSISYISEKGSNIRRALSMGHGSSTAAAQHKPRSKSDSSLGGFIHNQFSKLSNSLSSLDSSKLPAPPENIAPASARNEQRQAERPARTQRRSSISEHPRRSSMTYISEKENNIHRCALSMGHNADTTTTQHEPGSKRDSILGGFENNQFSKSNPSPSKFLSSDSRKLPIQEKFFPASCRSNDGIFDVLNQAPTFSDNLDAMNESSALSLSIGQLDDADDEGFDDPTSNWSAGSRAGELLVLFPTEPRQLTQYTRDTTARSA